GSYSDTDDATVLVLAKPCIGGIKIEKTVDADGDGVFHDTETYTAPAAAAASGIQCVPPPPPPPAPQATWKIVVTNTGDCDLTDVRIADSNGKSFGPISLASGASETYTYKTDITCDVVNVATATGWDARGGSYSDTDDATVLVLAKPCIGGIKIEKTVDADGDGVFHDIETIAGSSFSVSSVVAGGGGTPTVDVDLKTAHVGADSLTFNRESDVGGLPDPVVWHFVLNGLDKDAPPAQLKATFANAGTITVMARDGGGTQHFYVGTPGHDTLTGAKATVCSKETGQLVLSHVACNERTVTWKIKVTNTGDCSLDPVTIADSNGKSFGSISLAKGASKTYTYTTKVTGDTVNTATATGLDAAGKPYTDTDSASVLFGKPTTICAPPSRTAVPSSLSDAPAEEIRGEVLASPAESPAEPAAAEEDAATEEEEAVPVPVPPAADEQAEEQPPAEEPAAVAAAPDSPCPAGGAPDSPAPEAVVPSETRGAR
ncbi:MAG: hypothetical protein Q8K99_01950, partial [Actinomycetota bacterium]|nr:hypothetical protein [Actinomycetota bacterium]